MKNLHHLKNWYGSIEHYRKKCEFMSTYGANDEDAPHSFPSSAIPLSLTATTQKMPGSLEKKIAHNSHFYFASLGSMYFLFYFNWKTPPVRQCHPLLPHIPIRNFYSRQFFYLHLSFLLTLSHSFILILTKRCCKKIHFPFCVCECIAFAV